MKYCGSSSGKFKEGCKTYWQTSRLLWRDVSAFQFKSVRDLRVKCHTKYCNFPLSWIWRSETVSSHNSTSKRHGCEQPECSVLTEHYSAPQISVYLAGTIRSCKDICLRLQRLEHHCEGTRIHKECPSACLNFIASILWN